MKTHPRKLAMDMVRREGKFWNDPIGGPTNFGVRQKTLDKLRSKPKWKHLPTDVRDLTFQHSVDIAVDEYIKPFKLHLMGGKLAEVLTDITFMSWDDGVKILQSSLRLKPDGIVGPKTLGALDGLPEYFNPILASYVVQEFINSRPDKRFADSWLNRLLGVLNG